MKVLYTTDLHGNEGFYQSLLNLIKTNTVDIIINGGDMLPKIEPIFSHQKEFLTFLEKEYFPKIEDHKIHFLCQLGNDDLKIFDEKFDSICNKFRYIHNVAQKRIEVGDFEFIGFNLVTDYPFGLKDRCRRDKEHFEIPLQYGVPVFSGEKFEWKVIKNWADEIKKMPTLNSELADLPKPQKIRKTIYIIHMPPAGLGLDRTVNDDRPESWAVREFLETQQPLLSFHGHIHNSYQESGVWRAKLEKTICVQPGQSNSEFVYVFWNSETMELKRHSQKNV
ncbi:metallophosphoesterase [uncultured Desulfobacter sp.]|uniref:metallophosphoesterase family protein n=1 Tax=uncultured Desulfobacter sp. TaxID=240139 RepID=UPI0029F4DE61|nr:metallophosphoesterase [uncultured Desulfobacter sp.]